MDHPASFVQSASERYLRVSRSFRGCNGRGLGGWSCQVLLHRRLSQLLALHEARSHCWYEPNANINEDHGNLLSRWNGGDRFCASLPDRNTTVNGLQCTRPTFILIATLVYLWARNKDRMGHLSPTSISALNLAENSCI